MNRIRLVVTSGMVALLAAPALAQQAPAPAPPPFPRGFGYGPMMWHGPWHPGPGAGIVGAFVLLLALIGFVTVIALLVRVFTRREHWRGYARYRGEARPGRALDILEERFARGEIETAEFEAKRKLLAR